MSQRKKATAGLQSACARSLLACPAWNGRDLVRSRSRSHPAPAGRPRRRGPGGSGGGPSHGRRAQGLAVVASAPTRTPPAHPRTLPAARRVAVISPGPGSARHGMQQERGAPQAHVSPLRRATAGTADRGRGPSGPCPEPRRSTGNRKPRPSCWDGATSTSVVSRAKQNTELEL